MISANPVTDFVRRSLEKHALDAFFESTADAVNTFASTRHNGPLTFGVQCYENRLSRLKHRANESDNDFHIIPVGNNQYVPALRHQKFGPIALHVHNVKRPNYLPSPNCAQTAKQHATRDFDDLFDRETELLLHRMVGVVSTPTKGLEQVVVGELVQTRPDKEVYVLRDRVDLDLSNYDRGPNSQQGTIPPEPEAGPDLTIVKPDTGNVGTGDAS